MCWRSFRAWRIANRDLSGDMLIRWHMMADPAGMKRVMLDNLANYPKSEIMRRMLRPAIGESLFNADGPDWKWQRQAVTPVFTHRNVVALAPAMTATAERAAAKLAAGLNDAGDRAEIVSAMLTATFDVICDVALSGRDHFDSATFSRAITQYFQTAGRASLLDFLGFRNGFPGPANFWREAQSGPCMAWWRRRSKRAGEKARERLTIFWITCWRRRIPRLAPE